ncbi:MAG: hypothetical protein IJ557_06575 [Bacteroidaceae bacterium]|nr:hypothetical protein [Bacteroidaceae bacterium]
MRKEVKNVLDITENEVHEFINNRPFEEIVSIFAEEKWNERPLEEDVVHHLTKLQGLRLATIRENRQSFKRSMKMCKACTDNGMTTPAVVVPARTVSDWGLTVTDASTGEVIQKEDLDKYYCIMEGHGRLGGWLLSAANANKHEDVPFDFIFVFRNYATPDEFGRAYVSTNADMTRTSSKDRLRIAGARSDNPQVKSYFDKIKNDRVISKASYFWSLGRELTKDEVSKFIYGEDDAPQFDTTLTEALTTCYNSFKIRFNAEGAEKIYRGVPAAQWCATQVNEAENKTQVAKQICEKVEKMDNDIYTAIITAKSNSKKHITRDQVIKNELDKMMSM